MNRTVLCALVGLFVFVVSLKTSAQPVSEYESTKAEIGKATPLIPLEAVPAEPGTAQKEEPVSTSSDIKEVDALDEPLKEATSSEKKVSIQAKKQTTFKKSAFALIKKPAANTAVKATQTQANAAPSVDDLLKQAASAIGAGKPADALALLDKAAALFPAGNGGLWYLYGQVYEADWPSRNIKQAIADYRRVVDDFPFSARVSEARQRLAYLLRYYVEIR
jgi:hypothetical protein